MENLGLGGSAYFRLELFPVGCWKEAENLPVPKPKATGKDSMRIKSAVTVTEGYICLFFWCFKDIVMTAHGLLTHLSTQELLSPLLL